MIAASRLFSALRGPTTHPPQRSATAAMLVACASGRRMDDGLPGTLSSASAARHAIAPRDCGVSRWWHSAVKRASAVSASATAHTAAYAAPKKSWTRPRCSRVRRAFRCRAGDPNPRRALPLAPAGDPDMRAARAASSACSPALSASAIALAASQHSRRARRASEARQVHSGLRSATPSTAWSSTCAAFEADTANSMGSSSWSVRVSR
mmetsp:Transcript_21810/g.82977  ORF Transcript_21810/g.82977 Transcript_21810/m.82977 type:complete len:208 (+) Transcript_21810:654-1277(+)